ncbi:AIR synthase family protein [Caldicellulosiruptoraceae bacterium PP1]
MEIGKVPNHILKNYIFDNIKYKDEIKLYPSLGEDSAAVDISGNIAVLTCDPVTASDNNSGYISVIIVCNDLASSGAIPVGILSTILLPPNSSENEFAKIIENIKVACDELNITLLGGHSEVTHNVTKPIIISTGFGKTEDKYLVSTKNAKVKDKIIITKSLAIEGTAIIANDFEDRLKEFLPDKLISEAKNFIKNICVVKEGLIARKYANSMHDITEGGLFGALYEVCKASNVGAIIYERNIKLNKITQKICEHFNINPYKLISSGSMLITTNKAEELLNELKQNNIDAFIIGEVIESNEIKFIRLDGSIEYINESPIDEIYKVK